MTNDIIEIAKSSKQLVGGEQLLTADSILFSPEQLTKFAELIQARAVPDGYMVVPVEPEPVADDIGWIEWKGGKCPVARNTRVIVKLANGRIATEAPAFFRIWEHANDDLDIVAYCIAAAQKGSDK